MRYRYVVLGSGRQGTAAAYDLALFGEAEEIVLADADPARARDAAARVAKLAKKSKAKVRSAEVDAAKPADLAKILKGADGVLSALPHRFNASAAKGALAAKCHYADLGCHLPTTQAILKLHAQARKAKVSLIPDCGLAPGLGTSLVVSAIGRLDFAKEARIYVGGLPQNQVGALGYKLVYSLDSLLALYTEPAMVLRRGKIEELAPLSEREEMDFGPVGTLEACLTGGGGSTCPWTFQGRLTDFEYKTLRYPGHFEKIAAMRDMGFLDDKAVEVDGIKVLPKDLFLKLAGAAFHLPDEKDLVVLRVIARGKRQGRPTEVAYDLLDQEDKATGFSAMERTTGFPAAAVLWLQVSNQVPAGAQALETCLPHAAFMAEVRRRGLRIQESIRSVGACAS